MKRVTIVIVLSTALCVLSLGARTAFAVYGSTVQVVSGSLNSTVLNPGNPEVHVSSGASLTGTVNIDVQNNYDGGAITPVAVTPTWGNPQTSYWGINSWVPVGYSNYAVNVNLTAPTSPGTYYLVFTMSGVYNYDQLMSGTHPAWSAVWGTGQEVAVQPASLFEEAISNGLVQAFYMYKPSLPLQAEERAMTAVRIIVPEPGAISLCAAAAILLMRKRSAARRYS